MKPSPLHWLLCLGAMIGTIWAIGMLQASSASADLGKAPRSFTRGVQAPADPGKIVFSYRDFADSDHRFECHVDRGFSAWEEASFGLPVDEETNLAALDQRLSREIEEVAGPFTPYALPLITHKKASAPRYAIRWEPRLEPLAWNADLLAYLLGKAALVRARVLDKKGFSAHQDAVFRGYLHDHGFALKGRGDKPLESEIVIDYRGVADRARPWLDDCFDRFVREAAPEDDEEILSLLLAAFQALPFDLGDLPPVEEGGLFRDGFWVPAQVLRLGKADCDSSATALCAMWQRPGLEILLYTVAVPEETRRAFSGGERIARHAILAVAANPGPNQRFVSDGLRNYVLCEVIRPGGFDRLPIGETLLPTLPVPDSGICMVGDCSPEL